MKNNYILFAILLALISCEQIDESTLEGGPDKEEQTIQMTFNAVIKNESNTKTILAENAEDSRKKVFWQPGDEIAVACCNDTEDQIHKFVAQITENSQTADFYGAIETSKDYAAFYPHQAVVKDSSKCFVFDLPAVQKYINGSFDPEAAPMVTKATKAGEVFEFQNLCGLLALNLTGEIAVRSIVFKGKDANGNPIYVSGRFEVNTTYENAPEITPTVLGKANKTVTIICDEPVQLNTTTATTFHLMLPPGEYSDFTLIITSENGEIMIKESKSPIVIERSHIKPTGALEYVESEFIDLSANGHANCYIVPSANLYSFDATVIGNDLYGLMDGENFHTEDTRIEPIGARLLWQDGGEIIQGVTYENDGTIKFITTGLKGNALIAAVDANDTVIWSWHIWSTDTPQDQVYVNTYGSYTLMDRNIGATRADRGVNDQDWRDSRGLLYQWGRKDPFIHKYPESQIGTPLYMEELIPLPTAFISGNSRWLVDDEWSNNLWSQTQKTIYDPCPVGYRVVEPDAWYGFSKDDQNGDRRIKINAKDAFDSGYNFYYDDVNTTWYPASGYIDTWGNYQEYSFEGYMWSAQYYDWYPKYLFYRYWDDYDCYVSSAIPYTQNPSYAFSVRCMKDDDYEQTRFPRIILDDPTEISTTSIRLNASIISEGWGNITETGFIWGKKEDLSDGQSVVCEPEDNLFSLNLTALTSATYYYVKAYAKNEHATVYSPVRGFSTSYIDNIANLSGGGTANCYMIKPISGSYSFYAMTEGNSNDKITPYSADVLWQIDADRFPCENIVSNVRYSNGWILFDLPSNGVAGNALIVARDLWNEIIWSWHIWVVDYNPEMNYQVFHNGAKLMNRSLGASIELQSFNDLENDYLKCMGTLYQWGRKEPLTSLVVEKYQSYRFTDIKEAIAKPKIITHRSYQWIENFDETLWSPDHKTKYDPCPAGWRVTNTDAWTDLDSEECSYYGGKYMLSDKTYWFAHGEYYSDWDMFYIDSHTYYWTSNYSYSNKDGALAHAKRLGGYVYDEDMYVSNAYQVRCMKDE